MFLVTIGASESYLYDTSGTTLHHASYGRSLRVHPPRSRRRHVELRPLVMSTVSPPELSPVPTLNEKTRPVSPGAQSPTPLDGKAEVDRRSLSSSDPSPAQLAPASTRSTFASICIVAACTSAQLTSIGLGPAYAISVPYAGKDLHIQKEDLQWILNAYSISSVNNFTTRV